MALPDVQKRLDELGFEVVANTPDEFAARIKAEMEKWGKVIRDAKIKAEGAQWVSARTPGDTFLPVAILGGGICRSI